MLLVLISKIFGMAITQVESTEGIKQQFCRTNSTPFCFVEPTRHHCVFGSIIVKYYITEVLCWQHIGKEALTVLFRLFHRSFVGGVRIAIDASIQASVLVEDQLQTVLEAAIYQAHEIPSDYLPRYDIWSLDVYKQLHSNTGNNLHIHHIPTENGI